MKLTHLLVIGALLATGGNIWAASARHDSIKRLQMSTDVLHAIMNTPDRGIPESVINATKCIVVIPNLVKGGFIFGGEHGRGIASCRTREGWSAPAFLSVGGGSWGLQIGLQGVDVVMLVMNERGLQHLLSSKFELSGDAAASAGPVGRQATAGTDWTANTEILTYSRSHGLFAGITLNGAVVEPDADSTRAIYGSDPSFRSILSGRVRAPRSTRVFMRQIHALGRSGTVARADHDRH